RENGAPSRVGEEGDAGLERAGDAVGAVGLAGGAAGRVAPRGARQIAQGAVALLAWVEDAVPAQLDALAGVVGAVGFALERAEIEPLAGAACPREVAASGVELSPPGVEVDAVALLARVDPPVAASRHAGVREVVVWLEPVPPAPGSGQAGGETRQVF